MPRRIPAATSQFCHSFIAVVSVTTATGCIGWALSQERPVSLAVWGRASSTEADELRPPTPTAKYCGMNRLHAPRRPPNAWNSQDPGR